MRERVISGNPAELVQAPKRGRHLPGALDKDQMAKLLSVSGSDPLTVRDRAMMELLYSSGLRLGELIRLNVSDLDLADRTVRVLGKGNIARIVPVGSRALAALKEWLGMRRRIAEPIEPAPLASGQQASAESAALFVGVRRHTRLSPRNVQVRIAYWAEQQGITVRVHPHLFRHPCATHLLESQRSAPRGTGVPRACQRFYRADLHTPQRRAPGQGVPRDASAGSSPLKRSEGQPRAITK